MWPKKLVWRLFFTCLLIMGVPVALVTWYATDAYSKFYRVQATDDLKARAFLIASQMEQHLAASSSINTDSLCKTLAKKVHTRFTIIAPDGRVLGDSERNPDSMENHGSRQEIVEALKGGIGVSDRFSYTLEQELIYVAVPVYHHGMIAQVVRTSFPVAVIRNALDRLYRRITAVVALTVLLAALASFLVSRSISAPIAAMKIGARRFASGDFSEKLPAAGYEEAAELSAGLNEMARQLSEKIATITEQRNEQDAVLSSMIEGVIAIDAGEKIITINNAAASLFSIDRGHCKGRLIGEVLRNIEVQDFLAATLKVEGPSECELLLPVRGNGEKKAGELFLQLHGTALRGGDGKAIGALMVINDITRIKKLENIRKDFVANVSHELRTPLTSVKGYVETLQAGALDNRDEAQRFLGIIEGQVDRINSIVEDLLSLSRIEQDSERRAIELSAGAICDVLYSAADTCRHKASLKAIEMEVSCDKTIGAAMEKSLLEQAVVNLVDNAINYSDEKKKVWIRGEVRGGEALISVRDEGIGIPAEHLERIFERFYRVDKARSRKLGGTGLGLSIVKHTVLAHHGKVWAESRVGEGSTFYIALPLVK
ncbi:MAG TPA: ATP-binding protein [Chitinivibrionales bacterium]|nr:ATP-binding protein [Chitinivibrionales bacterium]